MFYLYAFLIAIGGTVPYLHFGDNRNRIPVVSIIGAFVANLVVAFLIGYAIVPFLYGPFGGPAIVITIFVFGLVNSVIAGMVAERLTHGAMIYIIFMVIVLFQLIAGSTIFRADSYRAMIGTVDDRDWMKDINKVDITHIRVVSKEQAEWLGNKVIGEAKGSLGSRYELGDYTIQRVQGELYWVAPLEFRGLFKWMKYRHSPGFVMVSAEDRNRRPELFTEFELRYMPSSWYGKKLKRHIFTNGWAFHGFTEYSFELDDNLKPYWVITAFHPTIVYFAPEVEGVLVVNPETGETTFYKPEEVPDWVDRVYPEKFTENYIKWHGKYVQGWFNSWIGEENVEVPTGPVTIRSGEHTVMKSGSLSLIYGNDGEPYWFTGLTSSSSKDQSLTGFVLVNSRTGEARRYRITGPNEEAVLEAVNNSVSNYAGYLGTQPIPYNIYGEFTWVVPVISEKKILQRIALVRASNATVKLGMDLRESLREYRMMLSSGGFSVAPTNEADFMTATLELTRVSTEVVGTRTLYYLYSANMPDRIFVATSDISPELPISQPPDVVQIGYLETREPLVQLATFNNTKLNIRTSIEQQVLTERRESAESAQEERTTVKEVRQELDDLSPEEIREIQEILNKRREQP